MSARGSLLGDWEGKLSKLIERAQLIASGEAREKLVQRAAKVIGSQQKREFKTKVGPDGATWPTAMWQTGELARSAFSIPEARGVRFGFGARHGTAYQKGKGRMAVALIPDGDKMGPVWGPRIQGSLRQMLAKLLKGQTVSSGDGSA